MTREEFLKKLEAEVAQAQAKLADLKSRAQGKLEEQREGHAEQIAQVEKAIAVAKDKLRELGESGEETWERLKEGAEGAWAKLKELASKGDPGPPAK